jgi:molecular chaperone GrpE
MSSTDDTLNTQTLDNTLSDILDTTPADDGQASSQWGAGSDETVALRAEIAQLREQLARSQADYSNVVRRNREEQSQIGEWTENKTILRFLPILDNLERALEHTPEEFRSHTWMEWLQSIVRSMQKILTDMWITKMNTVGQEVNPDLHDVISQIPHATTAIQAEVEIGYLRGEKALRHAKVIVWDGQSEATPNIA